MFSQRLPLFFCLLATASAFAQTIPDPPALAFEVASVRASKADRSQRSNVPLDSGNVYSTLSADDSRSAAGGYFVATHQPLWRYISFAYKLSGTQELSLRFNFFSGAPKSGAPFWVTGSFDSAPEFFDITARTPANTSIDEMRMMMQNLLADRFHLVTHTVTAEAPVFALVLTTPGSPGHALHPHSVSESCAPVTSKVESNSSMSNEDGLPPVCGVIARIPSTTPGQHYGGRAIPLSLLATSLPTMTGLAAMPRPVVDQTGLSGLYDFTLTWVHDMSGVDIAVSDNTDAFRDALKHQLGLQLKPSRAPIDFLLVDHVERPSEN